MAAARPQEPAERAMSDSAATVPERAAPDLAQPVPLADVNAALEHAERKVG